MDEKISLKAVDAYSEEFAAKISRSFFTTKQKISGPEILSLCEIQQINLFVICELLHSWKSESDKLKSPYFDYQAEAVAEALRAFQNTLSNHISISESDFQPLLRSAVSKTIFAVLSPYDYYSNALERMGSNFLTVATLKSDLKYLKINRAPLERLLLKLEEKKLTIVQRNEAFAMLDSILEEVNFTPEEIESHVARFTNVVPLNIDQLYESKVPEKKSTPAPLPTPVVKESEPVKHPYVSPTMVLPKTAPAVNKPIDRSIKTPGNLQKIARIKDSLTINQKFMFTKILFHGDFEIFSQAIDRIDTLDNFAQAENYIATNWTEWDKESTEYLEFRDMLERRFL